MSLPGGAALLIAFFLPWVAIDCGSAEMATASGFGAATGDWKASMELGEEGLGDEMKEKVRVPFELLLVPVFAGAVLLIGGLALGGYIRPKWWLLFGAGVVICGVLGFEGYDDLGMSELTQKPEAEQGAESPVPEGTEAINAFKDAIRRMRLNARTLNSFWWAVAGAGLATFVSGCGAFFPEAPPAEPGGPAPEGRSTARSRRAARRRG
ncbi:MAG: hypothetical protein ACYS22_20920 [Planctomycetota bacterium]